MLDGSTLNVLAKFPQLESSYLYATSITNEDVEEAKQNYPQHEMGWNESYVRLFFNYNRK